MHVTMSPELYLLQISAMKSEIEKKEDEIGSLTTQLEYERAWRIRLSQENESLREEIDKKTRRKKKSVSPENNMYSDFKSNGRRKPHAADPIRSYDDFASIQQYYINGGKIRDWALWTIGVSLGLRISDLLALKFKHIMDVDGKTYLPRIQIYEQKTGKLNQCLITEAVRRAMDAYLESIKYQFDLDDFVFKSQKTGGKMREEYGWKIISDAGKALGLPLSIGSHTMRKSFANIAACVDKSCIDMNAITKVQGLLNHSDQRVTLGYLKAYQEMFDRARVAVSEFVLGRSGVNEIIAGNQYTTDDVVARLDALEKILSETKGETK